MDGPMNYFFQFAQYLLPLAVLELYLRAGTGAGADGRARLRLAAALVLLLGAVYMSVGTVRYMTHKLGMLA
jgi:hypothetical protein